jgi:hypothetical protein
MRQTSRRTKRRTRGRGQTKEGEITKGTKRGEVGGQQAPLEIVEIVKVWTIWPNM